MPECAELQSATMTINLLHALAAALTVLLLFVRHTCISARSMSPVKWRSPMSSSSFCGDSCVADVLQSSENCLECTRSVAADSWVCLQPKYKKDPDIQIDSEDIIGVHPQDD